MRYPVGKRDNHKDALNAAIESALITGMRYDVFKPDNEDDWVFQPVDIPPPEPFTLATEL